MSGSSDFTIRIWDVEIGECIRVLEGHDELVRCIRFDNKRIVSGAYDGKIKIWDLKAALEQRSSTSSLCIQTLTEHTGRVFRLQFDDFQIVSSSHDDTIIVWDFLNYQAPAVTGNTATTTNSSAPTTAGQPLSTSAPINIQPNTHSSSSSSSLVNVASTARQQSVDSSMMNADPSNYLGTLSVLKKNLIISWIKYIYIYVFFSGMNRTKTLQSAASYAAMGNYNAAAQLLNGAAGASMSMSTNRVVSPGSPWTLSNAMVGATLASSFHQPTGAHMSSSSTSSLNNNSNFNNTPNSNHLNATSHTSHHHQQRNNNATTNSATNSSSNHHAHVYHQNSPPSPMEDADD